MKSAPMEASASAPSGGAAMMTEERTRSAGDTAQPVLPRKIIYTAETELTTKDFAKTKETVVAAVQKYGGYVAESNVSGLRGDTRTATWKVRIPVAQFDAFLKELGTMGDVENTRIASQDVSEEFYDIEARLKNKRLEEERLIQHLKASTGKLNEILAVEKEISRVREEIERMEGRRRFLLNQTDMTTVTVTVREMSQLVPTTAPGLPAQMGRVFNESLAAIAEFGRALLLFLVALLPWVALGGIVAVPIWTAARRRARARKAREAATPPQNGL